jgi:hypothetical protein
MTAPEDRLAALRERFLARAADDWARLAEADEAMARQIAHRLAGTAGTFGFADISEAAIQLDECAGGAAELARLREALRAALAAALQAR